MSYFLTEDDYNELDTVKNQLDLLAMLVMRTGTVEVPEEGLCSMFDALKKPVQNVLDAVVKRHAMSRENGSEMRPVLWAHAIKIASGDALHTPNGSEREITECLAKAAQIDEDMKFPFDAWLSVLMKTRTAEGSAGVAR